MTSPPPTEDAPAASAVMAAEDGGSVPPSAPTVRLLQCVCVLIVVLATVGYLVATVGTQLFGGAERSDFASYWVAGSLAQDAESPYPATSLAKRGRQLGLALDAYPFLYPPPFALAMQPLSGLPFHRARATWVVLSTACLLGGIALTWRVARLLCPVYAPRSPHYPWILGAAFVPAALNASSVHNDVRVGSVGALLLFLFALLVWALITRRAIVAGVALGLAALVKLFPVALVPYVWWRGGRKAGITCILVLSASMAWAMTRWGPGILRSYVVDALLPLVREPNAWPHNQSLDAFVTRLLVGHGEIVAPVHAPHLAAGLGTGLALLIVGWSLATLWTANRRSSRAGDGTRRSLAPPLEVACLVLVLLMAMKITWVHTLTSMLFVWPIVMPVLLGNAERGVAHARTWGLLACLGFFLSSAHFPVLWGETFKRWPGTAWTGVHLVGLWMLWICTLRGLRRREHLAHTVRAR